MKAKRQNPARSVSATLLDGTGGHVRMTRDIISLNASRQPAFLFDF